METQVIRFIDEKIQASHEIHGGVKPLSVCYKGWESTVFKYVVLGVGDRGLGWRPTFGIG